MRTTALLAAAVALLAFAALPLRAQDNTAAEIEKYRQALADGNPADLWIARGEDIWKQPRGPKHVALSECDLGLGKGVVKGVYVVLPRYFADAGQVMDLETRLLWCMTHVQGVADADARKNLFGGPGVRSDMEALSAYVTSESRGMKIAVALDNPQMREQFRIGRNIFFYRAGTHDFSCATCHGQDGKRIRLQDLPNLTATPGAQKAYATWPAYRVSQGELRTMQWRLNDCFRQQRFPYLEFGSPASIALTTFLAYNANGAVYEGPGLKR